MSKLRKRKAAQLAATFVVTTIGLGLTGCAETPPKKPGCHVHAKGTSPTNARMEHCHKNHGASHRHDKPRIAVNPPPPRR